MADLDRLAKDTACRLFPRDVYDPRKADEVTPAIRAALDAARDDGRRAGLAEANKRTEHLVSCILSVGKENTDDWMSYIADEVNKLADQMGEADRCCYDQRRGDLRIIRAERDRLAGAGATEGS